jgi:hypothetical protein
MLFHLDIRAEPSRFTSKILRVLKTSVLAFHPENPQSLTAKHSQDFQGGNFRGETPPVRRGKPFAISRF